MNDGAGWFSYEPFIGFGGDPNIVTQRLQDHVQVMTRTSARFSNMGDDRGGPLAGR